MSAVSGCEVSRWVSVDVDVRACGEQMGACEGEGMWVRVCGMGRCEGKKGVVGTALPRGCVDVFYK